MPGRILPRMSAEFRKRYFPDASVREWNDWRWQVRNSFRDAQHVERVLALTPDERAAFMLSDRPLPVAITPYYMSLIDPEAGTDPIRKTMVPQPAEHKLHAGESDDPLGEASHSPAPRIVHTYPNKVLFLVSDMCAVYCRFCTRARAVGSGQWPSDRKVWEQGLSYISEHKEVNDVLISGGDPLLLSDARLQWILERLHAIPHVTLIRIGTKVPAVLPQRITPALCRMLKRFHPLWLSIHFTHPNELTPPVSQACCRLADAGIPLMSQTVLLQGVNDDSAVMKSLLDGLIRLRVKPYYLHQCDPIRGSSHFRTDIALGRAIIRSLHGQTTGYAVPMFMLDVPGGGGKVPIGPEYVVEAQDL